MISVIIPCYNHAATLIKCLNSLVAQQIELEIIIVNDGSTYNTEEKIQGFGLHRLIPRLETLA